MGAHLATATNRNLFVLTIVTTVLLPPAFVTGFFGMNTKGLPFGDSDYGTLYAAIFLRRSGGPRLSADPPISDAELIARR
jgi:Mg2+ and Co2+ transporter CorA